MMIKSISSLTLAALLLFTGMLPAQDPYNDDDDDDFNTSETTTEVPSLENLFGDLLGNNSSTDNNNDEVIKEEASATAKPDVIKSNYVNNPFDRFELLALDQIPSIKAPTGKFYPDISSLSNKSQPSKAVALFRKSTDYESAGFMSMAMTCRNLGYMGDYGEMLKCIDVMKRRLDDYQRIGKSSEGQGLSALFSEPTEHIDYYTVYTSMLDLYANYYTAAGDFERALFFAKQKDIINEKLNQYKLPYDYYFLGINYANLGRSDEAYATINRINNVEPISIFGIPVVDDSDYKMEVSIVIYMALKDYAMAKQTLDNFDRKKQGAGQASWALAALSFLNDPVFGSVELASTAYTEATFDNKLEEAGYKEREKLLDAFNKSKISFETDDYKTAKQSYDAWLAHPLATELTGLHYTVYHDRGAIAAAEGDLEMAIQFYIKAIEVIEQQRSSFTNETAKIGFVGDKQQVYIDLVRLLTEQGKIVQAFEYTERGKSRALVDLLAQKDISASPKTKHIKLLQDFLDTTNQANVLNYSVPGKQRNAIRKAAIEKASQLSRTTPELASLVTTQKVSIGEIQRQLPKNETLIEYYGSADKLFVFLVTRQEVKTMVLKTPGLEQSISNFRQALYHPENTAYLSPAKKLYKQVFSPIKSYIKTKKISIVPHGSLHYLPFAALPTGNGFLIDDYSIRILPSASVMLYLKKNANKGTLLAMGNPDLKDAQMDLLGAQKEVENIAKSANGVKSYFRGNATETLVKSNSTAYSRLHFATHGEFIPANPLDSALLLSSDTKNDGRLTTGEIYDLDLHADLVTLSACETGLGKVNTGDDVIGLTRGFLYAGASSIVSSLWQVEDKTTAMLMTRFYDNLKKHDKRTALRKAQLSVKKAYKHPLYWAAFQLTGNN